MAALHATNIASNVVASFRPVLKGSLKERRHRQQLAPTHSFSPDPAFAGRHSSAAHAQTTSAASVAAGFAFRSGRQPRRRLAPVAQAAATAAPTQRLTKEDCVGYLRKGCCPSDEWKCVTTLPRSQ